MHYVFKKDVQMYKQTRHISAKETDDFWSIPTHPRI